MLCERCGKAFDGEGTLCRECAADTEAARIDAEPVEQAAVLPPVFETENTQTSLASNGQQVSQVPAENPQSSLAGNGQQVSQVPAENPQSSLAGNGQQVSQTSAGNPQSSLAGNGEPVPGKPEAEEASFTLSSPEAPKKKKRKLNGKLIAIIAAVVALIGGGCFFFFFTDAGKYMISSPEKYLQDVQKEELSTFVNGVSVAYDAFLDAPEASAGVSDVRFQAGDAFFDLAGTAGFTEAQLNWLRDVRITTDMNFTGNAYQSKLGFALGETEIVKADAILDMLTGRFYMALPGLNDGYLSGMLEDSGDVDPAKQKAAMDQLREDLPSTRAVNKMLNGFLDVALAEIRNVERAEETITVDGISEEQHVLTATITEGDGIRMVKLVLERAQTDETFLEILTALNTYAKAMDADADLYAEVMKEISEGITQLNTALNDTTSVKTVVVKTYVNHSGEITGRVVTVFSDGPVQEVQRYLSATADGVTKLQGSMSFLRFTGEQQTTGKVTTGKYILSREEEELLLVDVVSTEDQSTEVRLTPGKGIYNLLLQPVAAAGGVMGEDAGAVASESLETSSIAGLLTGAISFTITVRDPDADTDAPKVTMGAELNSRSLFTVTIDTKESESGDITIPKDYADAEDSAALEAWLAGVDPDTVIDRLRQAGVPEEILIWLENGLGGAAEAEAVA